MSTFTIGGPPVMQFQMGNAPQQQLNAWPRVSLGVGAPTSAPPPGHAQAAAQIPRQAASVRFAAPPLSVEQLEFARTAIEAQIAARPEEDEDVDPDEQAKNSIELALAKSTLEGLSAWIEFSKVIPSEPEQPQPAPQQRQAQGSSFGRASLGMPLNRPQQHGNLQGGQAPQPAHAPAPQSTQRMMPPDANSGSRYAIGGPAPLKFTMDGQRSIPDPGNAGR